MLAAWPAGLDSELVLEPTARSTIENASRSIPLLLERGIREATVVCAPLHAFRVRYFFERLYEAAGIDCDVRPAPIRRSPTAMAWEAGAMLGAPWQLRSARAELRAGTRR